MKVTIASISLLEDQAEKMMEGELVDTEVGWGLVNERVEDFKEVGAGLKRRGAVVKRASNLLNFRYSAIQARLSSVPGTWQF